MATNSRGRTQVPGNLADAAYLSVREKILRGVLALGAPVSSRGLAQEFGVSHLPVAQALRRLENEGFLESRPRAGTRVRVPSQKDIQDRYEVREAIETQAARLFAVRASAAQRRELTEMAARQDALFRQAEASHDRELLYAAHSHHFDLHMQIASSARCEALRDLIERNHILTFNWVYDVAANREPLPSTFHRDLAARLCAGDAADADTAMREHIRHGREERLRLLDLTAPTEWRGRRASALAG